MLRRLGKAALENAAGWQGTVAKVGFGPELADWAVRAGVAQTVFEPMIREARRQHMLVSQHYGKVELTWVFSNMTTRLYVGALLLQRVTGWYHDMQVRPFGGS